MKTYEVFWKNNSSDLVSLYKQIEHLINANIIGYDFDNNTYTVPIEYQEEFLAIAEENNCIAEEV
jgi:hypothetical protein